MRSSLALLLAFLGACAERPAGWTEIPAGEARGAHREQSERAERARDALGSLLVARLTAALSEEGAARAIAVCREQAPAIAREVAGEHAVRLGRTSFRLRNPANDAPEWARAAIGARRAEPAFFRGPEGELGALYPIRLQPVCTTCHGEEAGLAAEVRAALAELYPQDRATGFAAGDLRGWFWLEVPGTP